MKTTRQWYKSSEDHSRACLTPVFLESCTREHTTPGAEVIPFVHAAAASTLEEVVRLVASYKNSCRSTSKAVSVTSFKADPRQNRAAGISLLPTIVYSMECMRLTLFAVRIVGVTAKDAAYAPQRACLVAIDRSHFVSSQARRCKRGIVGCHHHTQAPTRNFCNFWEFRKVFG